MSKTSVSNKTFSRADFRMMDQYAIQELGIPGIVLMENAGKGSADYLHSHGIEGQVTICCGKGNNGGDGLVVARHLDIHGIPVKILLFANPEELQAGAKTNFDIAQKLNLPISIFKDAVDPAILTKEFADSSWIVDALFGTGLNGQVQPPFDTIIPLIYEAEAKVFSLDIPSGLDCDSGKPLGVAVEADYTVTYVGLKRGFVMSEAQKYLGQLKVLDIGVAWSKLEKCCIPA